MLSAISLQPEYQNLQVGPSTFGEAQFVSAPVEFAPTSSLKSLLEGGFIDFDATVVTSNLSDAVESQSYPRAQSYGSYNNQDSLVTSGWQLLSTDQATVGSSFSNGLQVIRFSTAEYAASVELMAYMPAAKLTRETVPSEEGGVISIPTLASSLQREEHLAKNEESTAPAVSETTGEVRHSAHSTISAKNLISGEWARAAVFETVSAEHSAIQLPDTSAQRPESAAEDAPTAARDVPVSAAMKSNGDKAPGQKDTAAVKQSDATPADVHQQTSETRVRPAIHRIEAADWHWLGDVRPAAASATLPTFINGYPTDVSFAGEDSVNAALASDALFDELSEPASTLFDAPTDDRPNLATRGAIPLLMILALERIATFNSRQSARASSTAPTPRCRRQPR